MLLYSFRRTSVLRISMLESFFLVMDLKGTTWPHCVIRQLPIIVVRFRYLDVWYEALNGPMQLSLPISQR